MEAKALRERIANSYAGILLLISIFFVGFAVRYLAHGPRIGPELDCWFHFRVVKYILTGGIPKIDPLAYYPTGREIYRIDLLGLPYFIAYSYKLIAPLTGLTLMQYMVAFPAIFTSLAAIPLYFLTIEIFDRRTALLTALFWQLIPATMTRTHAGFVDKETLASLYIFLFLYLFLISVKKLNTKNRKTLALPIFAGIFAGLANWTWGGTMFFTIVLGISAFSYAAVKKFMLDEKPLYISTIIFMVFLNLTRHFVQPQHFSFRVILNYVDNLILIFSSALFIAVILREYVKTEYGEENAKKASYATLAVIIIAGMLTKKLQQTILGLINLAKKSITLERSRIAQTVAENMPPQFLGGGDNLIKRIMAGDWYSHFNITLFIFPIGFILAMKRFREKKDFGSLFFGVMLLSSIFAMRSDIRLSFVLEPGLAMATAYACFGILDYSDERRKKLLSILKRTRKQKARYEAEKELANLRVLSTIFIFVLFSSVIATANASTSMLDPLSIDVPQQWYRAMNWIRENTEENAVIISWWDYGYWIQAIGLRRTVVDGGNAGKLVYNLPITEGLEYRGSTYHRDHDMALMFTSKEDEALKYLRPYVDYTKVPTYVLVSYEEFGKSSAINHIAQDDLYIFPQGIPRTGNNDADSKALQEFIERNRIESYFIVNAGNNFIVWITGFAPERGYDPEMKNKLLAKLLPFSTGYGKGLKHFKLVYSDPWDYILIYKVIP